MLEISLKRLGHVRAQKTIIERLQQAIVVGKKSGPYLDGVGDKPEEFAASVTLGSRGEKVPVPKPGMLSIY